MRPFSFAALILISTLALPAAAQTWTEGPGYQTFVIGDESLPTPDPVSGGLLMSGGGDWPYDAFRWFTAKAGHGHLVVLRASGTTESQDEFYNEIGGLVSVRTFLFTDRQAAYDEKLLAAVKKADGIFLAGGDQSRYVRMWRGTPLSAAIDAHVAAGKPLGGTSAGLAVQGAWLYGAMDDNSATSAEALADPLGSTVTMESDLFHFDLLPHIVTDSHFAARERLGRLIAFVLKSEHLRGPSDTPLAGLGIDEQTALVVETDGMARLYSNIGGLAWLVQPGAPTVLEPGRPLSIEGVRVTGIGANSTFNVRTLNISAPVFQDTYDVTDAVLSKRP